MALLHFLPDVYKRQIREWTVNMKNTGNDDHTFIAGILFLFL